MKIQKKIGGGGGPGCRVGGVRVDMIEELKFLGKFTKKIGGGGGGGGGGRFGGRGGGVGSGGGGGGSQGGCDHRIEVFVKIQKKKCGGVRGVGYGGRVDVTKI